MYEDCSYHIIDYLVPPSLEADKYLHDTLFRLESLSACAIVKDTATCKTLPKIPPPLHTVIWQAYLRDRYYFGRDFASVNHPWEAPVLPELPELLHHWPSEEFVLKKIMPSFPSKLSWFTHFLDDSTLLDSTCSCGCRHEKSPPLYQNKDYLQTFYNRVVEIIFESFPKSKSKDLFDAHGDHCKIRKLDISGFTFSKENQGWDENPDWCSDRCLDTFDKYHNFVSNLEVILDTRVIHIDDIDSESEYYNCDDEFNSDIEGTGYVKCDNSMELTSYNAKPSNKIVKFRHLELYGSFYAENSIEEMKKIITKNTKSVHFGVRSEIEISELIKDLFETINDQINFLTFEFEVGFDSMRTIKFLQYFKNLEHLNISDSNLHGKLDPLLHMEKGLCFLYLRNCSLNNSDLDVLLRSCHKSSLLELNLSQNSFSENSTNLIKLCQELPNVIKLNLDYCRLEKLHDKDLLILCDSINKLPNLAHLSLYGNEFSKNTILSHLPSLGTSPSLRLLQLMMPAEEIQGSWKKKAAAMSSTMNKERSQFLYVEFGDDADDDYGKIQFQQWLATFL